MTKTFTPTVVVPVEHIPNTFEVEIEVMHGDADMFDTFTVRSFYKDEDLALSSLVETLDRMIAKYPHGRGGSWPQYGYQDVEGFYSWFGDFAAVLPEEDYATAYPESTVPYADYKRHALLTGSRKEDNDDLFWPGDCTGADIEASIKKYTVYYYNYNKTKFFVKVGN